MNAANTCGSRATTSTTPPIPRASTSRLRATTSRSEATRSTTWNPGPPRNTTKRHRLRGGRSGVPPRRRPRHLDRGQRSLQHPLRPLGQRHQVLDDGPRILNNRIHHRQQFGIAFNDFLNGPGAFATWVFGNQLGDCAAGDIADTPLLTRFADPGTNPNKPQNWY